MAVGGSTIPLMPESASAAEITDAITDVNVVENNINSGLEAMRLDVSFDIGAGIGRGGTAQEGDTFWLQMDPRISAQSGTFDVYAIGSDTDVVASVTMVGGSRATFTLTDYVNNRSFTEGSAFWGISFRNSSVPADTYTLNFETAAGEYDDPVTVETTHKPGTGGVNPPLINGVWYDFDQQRGTWKVMLPNGPHDTLVFEGFGWTSGPEWKYDCDRTLANQYAYRYLAGTTVEEISIECEDDYIRWELANVPEYSSTNSVPTLKIDFDVVDPSQSGDLVFKNPNTYTINGGTPRSLTGELRQTRGGGALGPTTPSDPTITQSTCIDGAPSAPAIALPLNGSGVTYDMNIDDYGPGDTVEVIAELSTGYEWELPLSDAWEIVSAGVAIYTVVLNDSPDCVLAPSGPTVTPASCLGSTVADPEIALPAAIPGIEYSINPVDFAAGDTVQVFATLESTDYDWDDDLPSGWTIQSDTVAVFTVILDGAPDCRTVSTPVSPSVMQTTCAAGSVVLPAVGPADNTSGILYATVGTIEPGATVQVIATLTGPDYVWGALPTGWESQSATTAIFSVSLDPDNCDAGGAVLASTGLGDLALPIGIATGGILLLSGLALLAVRARRGAVGS